MSDLAWIALIIIVYMVAIKPMMQGMLNQKPPKQNGNKKPADTKAGSRDGDYVDYEDISDTK
ncbi:MAG: hypothetical protein R2794_07745 [Chitinophagales bacterium]